MWPQVTSLGSEGNVTQSPFRPAFDLR